MKLSAPWETYYREIKALFGSDPAIKIKYDDETKVIKMYVEGQDKADALAELLPSVKMFGNVPVHLDVVPSNFVKANKADTFCKAFDGNPVFAYAKTTEGSHGEFAASYIVFKKKVVQFSNDDLSDVNGNCNTLYQTIAKDIFGEDSGVFFCTE